MKRIIYGAFVGVLFISFLFPLISFLGLNKITFLIVFYSFPLVGVITTLLLENENKELKINNIKDIQSIIKKNVILRTNQNASFQGIIKDIDEKIIILERARRLDLPDAPIAYMVFIDRNEIKSMEIL